MDNLLTLLGSAIFLAQAAAFTILLAIVLGRFAARMSLIYAGVLPLAATRTSSVQTAGKAALYHSVEIIGLGASLWFIAIAARPEILALSSGDFSGAWLSLTTAPQLFIVGACSVYAMFLTVKLPALIGRPPIAAEIGDAVRK